MHQSRSKRLTKSADGSGAQDGDSRDLSKDTKKLAGIGSLMEDDFVLRKPPASINRNNFQQAACNRFNINHLKTSYFNRFQ
jgi:hypothetical protein